MKEMRKEGETDEKSMFLEFFGDSPSFRIMDFLLEHRLQDFTKTEISKGANVSWAALFNCWKNLEKHKIVKLTRTVGRAKLYQLNESEPIVKKLKEMEMALIRQSGEMEEEKVAMKMTKKK